MIDTKPQMQKTQSSKQMSKNLHLDVLYLKAEKSETKKKILKEARVGKNIHKKTKIKNCNIFLFRNHPGKEKPISLEICYVVNLSFRSGEIKTCSNKSWGNFLPLGLP